MPKLIFIPKFPFFTISEERHRKEMAAIQKEVADLRSRLVAAQDAKNQAQKQCDELRNETDRLRGRVAAHKTEMDNLGKVNDRLQAKILSQQEEIDELKSKAIAKAGRSFHNRK